MGGVEMTTDKKCYMVVNLPSEEVMAYLKSMIFTPEGPVVEIEIDRRSVEWALRTGLKYLNAEDSTIVEAWLQKHGQIEANVK
jgi:hypothetical protein